MLGLKRLLGYEVRAQEARIGVVHDFLIEETTWTVSSMTVRIGSVRSVMPIDCVRSSDVIRRSIDVSSKSELRTNPAETEALSRIDAVRNGKLIPDAPPLQRVVPSLRSVREMAGCRTNTPAGLRGICVELLADTETWTVPYLVVNTREWFPHRHVLVPSAWVRHIRSHEMQIDIAARRPGRAQRFEPASHDVCHGGANRRRFDRAS